MLWDKLDIVTKTAFERDHGKIDLPTYTQLTTFLIEYASALVRVKRTSSNRPSVIERPKAIGHSPRITKSFSVTNNSQSPLCPLCKMQHFLYQCNTFVRLTANERFQKVKELKLCINCVKGHMVKNCNSKFSCKTCTARHHTMLHMSNNTIPTSQSNPSTSGIQTTNPVVLTNLARSETLLATAIIQIRDNFGRFHSCRCLLDAASQAHFISASFAKKLELGAVPIQFAVNGINKALVNINSKVDVHFRSQYVDFEASISCLMLPTITSNLPTMSFDIKNMKIPCNIILTDPQFHISREIDMLIGAGLFWDLLLPGHLLTGQNKPSLEETKLGWVVAGDFVNASWSNSLVCCLGVSNSLEHSLDNTLRKFWEIEEPNITKSMSFEEKHFAQTVDRDNTGRFVVRLPFNSSITQLGESKHLALRRFYSLEKKLLRSESLAEQYTAFMTEYSSLGHMAEISSDCNPFGYYIPHHAVVKESVSTKLRVVFDASMKTVNGPSLNQCQMIGPVVQSDLLSILLRFRQHSLVLVGDVKMMYRQIWVHPQDRHFQRIFWRSSPSNPVKIYELNTVTYGTAGGPYIATRCLKQLADDSQLSNPEGSRVIANDFYVDDLITGSDSIEDLINIRHNVCSILRAAGFELRKFMANNIALLADVEKTDNLQVLQFGEYESCKTLGIGWNSGRDTIQYSIRSFDNLQLKHTKRNILSIISSVFDPLGLVGPVIIVAKMLMQTLWEQKLNWADVIPDHLQQIWIAIQSELHHLNSLAIPRHALLQNAAVVQLHGFSDASLLRLGAQLRC